MAFNSKAKPTQVKGNRQRPSPEIAMEPDQTFNGSVHSRHRIGCASFDDDGDDDEFFMALLNKFQIERIVYDLVESSFEAMYMNLIPDVEYFPVELVGGYPLNGNYSALDAHMKTVLCLKHMATLPNSRIKQLQWDTFTLA
jgi:hypothetical protein